MCMVVRGLLTIRVWHCTAPDATPPVFLPGYPKVGGIVGLNKNFNVSLLTDESCVVHYVVVTKGAPALSANNVRNGIAAGGWSAKASDSVAVIVEDNLDAVRTPHVFSIDPSAWDATATQEAAFTM